MCVCVCVPPQPAGSGIVSRLEDRFHSATDLTLICSVLLAAAGFVPPERAEQTCFSRYRL